MIVHMVECFPDCKNRDGVCGGRSLYIKKGDKLLRKERNVKTWQCENYACT